MARSRIGTPGGSPERPALFFSGAEEFRAWLEANHESATELWMGLHKKHVRDPGLSYPDAVIEALCFGWIDSTAQRIDEDAVRQRWTPRKATGIWSTTNVATVERLIAEGRMRPAGLAAYAHRQDNRTGVYAYEQAEKGMPPDEDALLRADPAAAAFWDTATASYRKMCIYWVLSAKREETRARRLAQLVDDCAHGRLIPPQRYGDVPTWVARAASAAEAAARLG
jgi:uncharacterized protein YdeI (YjbR/CyaY-like superfamily)